MNPEKYLYSEITEKIITAYFTVYNSLGYGFLEKVYENALLYELRDAGLKVENQKLIKVYYRQQQVGFYYCDLLVENKVIIEVKAAESLCMEHEFQVINYLKATEFEVGLLLNFGKHPAVKRKIFSNDKKEQ